MKSIGIRFALVSAVLLVGSMSAASADDRDGMIRPQVCGSSGLETSFVKVNFPFGFGRTNQSLLAVNTGAEQGAYCGLAMFDLKPPVGNDFRLVNIEIFFKAPSGIPDVRVGVCYDDPDRGITNGSQEVTITRGDPIRDGWLLAKPAFNFPDNGRGVRIKRIQMSVRSKGTVQFGHTIVKYAGSHLLQPQKLLTTPIGCTSICALEDE